MMILQLINYCKHSLFTASSRGKRYRYYTFDCPVKFGNSYSLNECLLTGPSRLNDLGSIWLRFRRSEYTCVANIEKAFGLNEAYRDCWRFFCPRR